jgi:hypothetical protein
MRVSAATALMKRDRCDETVIEGMGLRRESAEPLKTMITVTQLLSTGVWLWLALDPGAGPGGLLASPFARLVAGLIGLLCAISAVKTIRGRDEL